MTMGDLIVAFSWSGKKNIIDFITRFFQSKKKKPDDDDY